MAEGGFNWSDILPQAKGPDGKDLDMNELMDQRMDEARQPFEDAAKGINDFGKAAGDFVGDKVDDAKKGVEDFAGAVAGGVGDVVKGVTDKAQEVGENASKAFAEADRKMDAYEASHAQPDAYDRASFGLS